ncbi:penicillin-binding protein 2 [Heliobacterium gestii]|uniref:Penicillin-binding protein 2 n=1 Tax=Heliomicrobium gestii TaxID=2699 RepID=A0A845LFJ1_HELGE|nr:penicillin-binding protein 2 [Heliomicrobium gestii]MBM7866844.1 penicillin-binding protein 2 [Heliomicrobium gestii]MZP42273.1 penicillin-binding protein 2 [Heliomicrobium gestii]
MSLDLHNLVNEMGNEMTVDPPAAKRRKDLEKTLRFFAVAAVFVFLILISRLFYLQFVASTEYLTTSEENRIKMLPIPAMRGDIVDRNGATLATSVPVFNAYVTYLGIQNNDREAVVQKLVQILGANDPTITADYISEQFKKRRSRLYEPILIKSNLTDTEVAMLEERRAELPGVVVEKGPVRSYPSVDGSQIAGHLLGYVRQISPEELKQYGDENYRLDDMIGKTGLEKAYEKYLRGRDGYQQVEINQSNRPIRNLYTNSPTPGDRLVLTIDSRVQKAMEETMDRTLIQLQRENAKAKAGAAVLINVRTGAILGMVSRPALNPNDFVGAMNQEKADYYFRSDPPAGINRVIQASYPPGSTFKPITAMAALEAERLNPYEKITCTGAYWEKPNIKCWSVHGAVNLNEAVAGSCNVYFQEMGRRAGIDNISRIAREFGLGQETGILLPGEEEGLLPGRDWKRAWGSSYADNRYQARMREQEKKTREELANAQTEEEKGKIQKKDTSMRKTIERDYRNDLNYWPYWQPYETYNTSIGQGRNQYTVLQIANYIATLANGGTRFQPYMVDRIETPDKSVVQQFGPTILNQVSVSPEHMATVRRAMLAVTEPGGTASYLFHNFPVKVAAKTGTAETGRAGDNKDKDYHGVFVAFAPYDNPEVAYAGVVEYGYHGGASAGVVARAALESYFGVSPSSPDALVPFGRVEE